MKLKLSRWQKLTGLGIGVFCLALICKVFGLVLNAWVLCGIAIAIWCFASYLEIRDEWREHQRAWRKNQKIMTEIHREILEDLYRR